jgi:hypothetical protein
MNLPLLVFTLCLAVVVTTGCGDDEESPGEFLNKVEAALSNSDKVAHVNGRTELIEQQARPIWSSDAWYDVPNKAVRILHKKDAAASLDIPDERLELRVGSNVYDLNLGKPDEPVRRFSTDQLPNCFQDEPQTVVLKLLCADVFNDGSGRLDVEGVVDFEGKKVRSLALIGPNTTTRLLVDPDSYLPVAQTLVSQGQSNKALIRTVYAVELIERNALSGDLFDPRSLGYNGQ